MLDKISYIGYKSKLLVTLDNQIAFAAKIVRDKCLSVASPIRNTWLSPTKYYTKSCV